MAKFGFYRTPPLLVLLTDFGDSDCYAGVMKGVIYSVCDDVRIVDLTHRVPHQDVTGAAFTLMSSYGYFPHGAIFVCVVDPGVGGDRDIICMKAGGRIFLAPDNGLLSLLQYECDVETIRVVKNRDMWLDDISNTFHGRDIFAPVAAHLASGRSLESVGPEKAQIRDLRLPHPVRTTGGTLKGEVIYVDQFGNLITNIGAAVLQANIGGSMRDMTVSVGDSSIKGVVRSYSAVKNGELLALIGSSGYLEIAVNRGSAREKLGSTRGSAITVKG